MSTNTRGGIGKAPLTIWGLFGPWKLHRVSGRVEESGNAAANENEATTPSLDVGPFSPAQPAVSIAFANGGSAAFKLAGLDLECQPGHEVTLISAIPAFRSTGPYLAARNHTTGKTFFCESTLRRIFLPSTVTVASGVGGISLGLAGLGVIRKGVGIGVVVVAGIGLARFIGLRKLVAFKRTTDFDAYAMR